MADKRRSAARKAVDTLVAAAESGDVSAAVAILRATAFAKLPPPAGPIDGQQIIDGMVEARFKAKCAAKDDDLMRSLTSNPYRDHAAAPEEVEAEIAVRLNGASG